MTSMGWCAGRSDFCKYHQTFQSSQNFFFFFFFQVSVHFYPRYVRESAILFQLYKDKDLYDETAHSYITTESWTLLFCLRLKSVNI